MKNKEKFQEFMSGLAEIFDKKLTDTLSSVYWKALAPFDDNECVQMFERIISTCKFFPKPAEMIELMEVSPEDNQALAWQEVMEVLRAYHPQLKITSGKPEIEDAVRALGGWDYLSLLDFDELKWTEKRFKEHYEVAVDKVGQVLLPDINEKVAALIEAPKEKISLEQAQDEALEFFKEIYGGLIPRSKRKQVEREIDAWIKIRMTGKKQSEFKQIMNGMK